MHDARWKSTAPPAVPDPPARFSASRPPPSPSPPPASPPPARLRPELHGMTPPPPPPPAPPDARPLAPPPLTPPPGPRRADPPLRRVTSGPPAGWAASPVGVSRLVRPRTREGLFVDLDQALHRDLGVTLRGGERRVAEQL